MQQTPKLGKLLKCTILSFLVNKKKKLAISYTFDIKLKENVSLRKFSFLISQPKHMLWVLKRIVSMRRFFWAYVKIDG